MVLTIKVYEKDNKTVKKECTGETCEIMFGTVRKLMKLFEVEEVKNNIQLLKTIYDVWGELTGILEECFPEMEKEDWDHVKIKELIPILLQILKGVVGELSGIPTESKNVIGV